MKADFEKSSPLSAFNAELFDRTVSAITIDKDKKVCLKLKNNNLDCLLYVRELKEMGIPIIFEKEGINTLQVSSELLITLFSGLSQAESESISMNVKIGKRQSLKNGNVPFSYKSFLGYRNGADGKPEIDEEQNRSV